MFLKADDLLLLFLPKKLFFVLGMTHNDPFFAQIGPKKTIFKWLYQLFFRTNRLQHKLLILIESPIIFYWKSAKRNKVGVVFGSKFGPN